MDINPIFLDPIIGYGWINGADDPPSSEEPAKDTSTGITNHAFPQFPLLPAELRILIWNAATDQRLQPPRVINMFIRGPFSWDHGRMAITNLAWLRAHNAAGNLLRASAEARAVARRYLDLRPGASERSIRVYQSRRIITAIRINEIGSPLLSVHADPKWDVLFLNGLDLDAAERNTGTHPAAEEGGQPSTADVPILLPPIPPRVSAWALRRREPFRSEHSLALHGLEAELLCQFSTVIMPVQGLVEPPLEDRRLCLNFTAPFLDWSFERLAEPVGESDRRRTFIALVGDPYRGRNLQMEDIEFIPDAEIHRVWGEATQQHADNGRVESSLHRDVLVMKTVWESWELHLKAFRDADLKTLPPQHPRVAPFKLGRLRFARVKGGVD